MSDVLEVSGQGRMTLNGKPFSIPEGFDWVSPVKTDYYSLQCVTCTGWVHASVDNECATCMALSNQRKWLQYHRKWHSGESLQEMAAAYRIKCDTGNVGPIREWCSKYMVDQQSVNRV